MKSDEDVRMIASEAPILFAKACEFFILELTHRAWSMSEDIKRKTLQRVDVARAIAKTDTMDFLQDIITVEEGAGPGPSATPTAARGAGPAPGEPTTITHTVLFFYEPRTMHLVSYNSRCSDSVS